MIIRKDKLINALVLEELPGCSADDVPGDEDETPADFPTTRTFEDKVQKELEMIIPYMRLNLLNDNEDESVTYQYCSINDNNYF